MKKRKELNALIGLGDSKRKKPKKGSGHRLLRTEPPDSESDSSSEDDDFNGLNGGASFGKRSYAQCCNVCYPLFLFIILAACVMACAGLIWMQIALKEDLDALKEKLHSMETSQKASSSEIPKLGEELKDEERKLDELENGSAGLNKLWSNLTEMNRKISLLESAVNHLKANLKSAADLISLPTTVEELQKSVATIGSTLTSVQHDVKTMQDALEHQQKDEDVKKTTDITDLRKAMSDANRTEEQHHTWTDEQIHVLLSTVADLHHRVASLENGSKRGSDDDDDEAAAAAATVSGGRPAAEAATVESAAKDAAEPSPPVSPSQTSRRPRFLSRNRKKRASECPTRLYLPGVTSMQVVVDLFGRFDPPGVSWLDIRDTLSESELTYDDFKCFDKDGDGRLSLSEIKAAMGL